MSSMQDRMGGEGEAPRSMSEMRSRMGRNGQSCYKEKVVMHWIYAHLIGDYILQNDWMALHKKRSSFRCFVHVTLYMLPFLLCSLTWWQFLLIAIQHYLIDRTKFVAWFMTAKGQHEFATGMCFPWSQIVMDNILHILWIAFVIYTGSLL